MRNLSFNSRRGVRRLASALREESACQCGKSRYASPYCFANGPRAITQIGVGILRGGTSGKRSRVPKAAPAIREKPWRARGRVVRQVERRSPSRNNVLRQIDFECRSNGRAFRQITRLPLVVRPQHPVTSLAQKGHTWPIKAATAPIRLPMLKELSTRP